MGGGSHRVLKLPFCAPCILNCPASYWNMESGEVDLVSGPQPHTNCVACLEATPERLYSLGLDKALKSAPCSTNEFE